LAQERHHRANTVELLLRILQSKTNALRSDFAWMLAGNVLYSACQWSLIAVLAKLGNAEQVGVYAFAVALATPIVYFANLQLRALVATDVRNQFTPGQFLSFRMLSLAAAFAVVAGLALVQHTPQVTAVVILIGAAQSIESLSDAYYGFMQRFGKIERISWSLFIKGPLALVALGVVLYTTGSLVWSVAASVAARLAVLVLWDSRKALVPPLPEWSGKDWNGVAVRTILRLSLPLGIISMLSALNSSVPRYFVEAHAGAADLGIFSAIASLLSAGQLVVTAFGQAIFVPVARACVDRDYVRFRTYAGLAAGLGVALGAGAILCSALFGAPLLTKLFRPEYGARADLLTRLMIVGMVVFVGSGLGYTMTAARALRPQIPIMAISVVVSGGIAAWQVPARGLFGAADAALGGAVVQLIGAALILARIDRGMRQAPEESALQTAGAEA
jgi:O-antigen/teichoic acid export membrane protein